MMTSSRPLDNGESFASRRGHSNQLSISDPSHHVTEAIGTLYDDSDDDSLHEPRRNSRPLSFLSSPYGGEQIQKTQHVRLQSPVQTPHQISEQNYRDKPEHTSPFTNPTISSNSGAMAKAAQTPPAGKPSQKYGLAYDTSLAPLQPLTPLSPTLSLRDVQPDAHSPSQFPLTNIDNPDDIAQELSNLQALRRMSIDVGNTADPDLMPFQGLSLMAMPSIAPTGEDDEGDISRLLWVPAKVHPELAPEQFKSFLENRVQSMKRRSGESLLSIDTTQANSTGLLRKKSMLSRQMDNGGTKPGTVGSEQDNDEHTDPAGRRRGSSASISFGTPELSLNELVKDPSRVVQKLAMDTQRQTEASLERSNIDDDKPILPAPSMGLRRSTRTTYRKGGSLRSGNRQLPSKRAAARQVEKDNDRDADGTRVQSSEPHVPGRVLQRVLSEPISAESSSHPSIPPRKLSFTRESAVATVPELETTPAGTSENVSESGPLENSVVDSPNIMAAAIATAELSSRTHVSAHPPEPILAEPSRQFPQRSSSQVINTPPSPQSTVVTQKQQARIDKQHQQPPPRSNRRPSAGRASTQQAFQTVPATVDSGKDSLVKTAQTTHENNQQSSPAVATASSRTDNAPFTPSMSTMSIDDRRTDKKVREKDEGEGSKSMTWKWFKNDDRDKKKKDKEDSDKKARAKAAGERIQADKPHDNTRLDVLQSSINNANNKGRESFVLDRDSSDKPREEKKKESSRKSSEARKERDGFSFGSIFGGSRKKENKDSGGSKGKQRAVSPEPQTVVLRPDVDYPYTRFPIVEERAIYRMAHLKLANPRRDLRSQVLLSNFMYSYLAKVQAMHPQLNVPISPQQKRQEEERKRREQEEQQQMQQQAQASMDEYGFEYRREANQHSDVSRHEDEGDRAGYDNGRTFDYAYGDRQNHDSSTMVRTSDQHERSEGYEGADQNSGPRGYYDYGQSDDSPHDDDGMW